MAYSLQNANGQASNSNSSPVVISSDQISSSNHIATEEAVILLRRLVKILESNATVDGQNRQRVVLDNSSATCNINTVTGVTTVSSVTTVGSLTGAVSSVGNLGTVAGYDQRQFIDGARSAFANAIRSKLTFS